LKSCVTPLIAPPAKIDYWCARLSSIAKFLPCAAKFSLWRNPPCSTVSDGVFILHALFPVFCYISRTIELAPQDAPRIEKAATTLLAELEATPETFYERNRRGLERLGSKLHAWNAKGEHTAVVKKLTAQLDTVCRKLPEGDEARAACSGAFMKKPTASKA
jgi:hypothetical protein